MSPPVVLDTLELRDFRNIARADLSFSSAGLAIVGPNGHGKTNLLEAIHYLHALRSMRGARDPDLVRFGAEGFHVHATVSGAAVDDMRVGFIRHGKKKRVTLDGVERTRLADALGGVPSVMFSPRDVELVGGAPTERRRFLDIVLATTSPRYLVALQRYRAALVRRNATLREVARHGHTPARIAVWEPALAESAATLWCERVRWTQWAASRMAELCAAIGERERVTLRYQSSLAPVEEHPDEADIHQRMLSALERDRSHDTKRGLTHSGPHRDDLALMLGGHALRAFGSAGQQRTAAIALRLLERETLRERTRRSPIILLDDPFAELDAQRAASILELLAAGEMGQTILAVPRDDDVPRAFTTLERRVVRDGVIGADA
jgi:DNA replication and repair protein RecF